MSWIRHLTVLSVVLVVLAFTAAPASAVTFTWDGGGTDDNVATAKNWAGNVTPKNDGSSSWMFQGGVRTKPVAFTMWNLFRIVYPNGEQNTFTLGGARLFIGYGGILNGSSKAQTINNDITLVASPPFSGPHVMSNEPGQLHLHGDIDFQSETVRVHGEGSTRLYGNITGVNGGLEVGNSTQPNPGGTLILSGTVNIDVNTNIGTLIIDTNQPQPPFTTLAFAGGTNFSAAGPHAIQNSLLLNGNVTYEGSGNLQLNETIRGGGSLTVSASSSAVLGLGPVNNFPFLGQVEIIQGQLELNGGGTIAQLAGTLLVGNSSGGAQTAVLRGSNAGVLAPNLPLTVRSDGLVDIVGPIAFSSLNLYGGALVVAGTVDAEPINAGASGRTAILDGLWSMPVDGLDYDLVLSPGSADPDIELLGGCQGPGTLRIGGDGQAELRGDPALGPKAINVMQGKLVLDRTGGPSMLATAGGSGTIRMHNNDQLGSGCDLNLLPGGTLDVVGFQESVGQLYTNDAQIVGLGGALTVHDNMQVFGNVTCQPWLVFAANFADVVLDPTASLTTGTVVGINLHYHGGGTWTNDDFTGNLTVFQGTYRSEGLVDGDLDVDDTLEIPAVTGVGLDVNGTLDCGPNSHLVASFDASGAVAGDEFLLIQAQTINGSFSDVQPPSPPAGHYWELAYGPGILTLRLENTDNALLELAAGTNGQGYPFPESAEGVVGIDFTIAGSDPVELCSVEVDSVRNQQFPGTIGVRLYRTSDQQLLASIDEFLPQGQTLSDRVYALGATLNPGVAYRIVFHGITGTQTRSYEPDLPFPYMQSSLAQINGTYATYFLGDVFPDAPLERVPYIKLDIGPCAPPTAVETEAPQTNELTLGASPNPFNPRTTLSFYLPSPGRASIDVYDVGGRHIAQLLDEHKPSGRHRVRWSGIDKAGQSVSSGIYFIRLSHPAGNRVHRVTLLK